MLSGGYYGSSPEYYKGNYKDVVIPPLLQFLPFLRFIFPGADA